MTWIDRDSLPPESTALACAQGYYELGMLEECWQCLAELPLPERLRPDAQELQALLLIQAREWESAITHCRHCVKCFPDLAFGYVNLAFAYHEVGETERALRLLEHAHPVVSIEPVALYNRGCYLVKLRRHKEGLFWLTKALDRDPSLRSLALRDPDLEGIRCQLHDAEPLQLFDKED